MQCVLQKCMCCISQMKISCLSILLQSALKVTAFWQRLNPAQKLMYAYIHICICACEYKHWKRDKEKHTHIHRTHPWTAPFRASRPCISRTKQGSLSRRAPQAPARRDQLPHSRVHPVVITCFARWVPCAPTVRRLGNRPQCRCCTTRRSTLPSQTHTALLTHRSRIISRVHDITSTLQLLLVTVLSQLHPKVWQRHWVFTAKMKETLCSVWRQSQETKLKPWTRATMGDRERCVEAPVHPPPMIQ